MDDFSQKIGEILSDPEMMRQIEQLSSMLGKNDTPSVHTNSSNDNSNNKENFGVDFNQNLNEQSADNSQFKNKNKSQSQSQSQSQSNSMLDPSLLSTLTNSNALSLITKAMPLIQSMKQEDDTTRLLNAIRPFLSEKRQKKLDEASKMLKMLKLLPLLKDFNLLDGLF